MQAELEDAIDDISRSVPKPDDAVSAEQHAALRAYWDLISLLSDVMELSVNEWEG